jgi:hypothetical protein
MIAELAIANWTPRGYYVMRNKTSGVTRKLKAKYCELHGIKSPGVNYINIDKDHFLEWRNNL